MIAASEIRMRSGAISTRNGEVVSDRALREQSCLKVGGDRLSGSVYCGSRTAVLVVHRAPRTGMCKDVTTSSRRIFRSRSRGEAKLAARS
jgi:hypothetical protein